MTRLASEMTQPAPTWARACGHFITITRHKQEVMRLLFACGLPRQALLHDLSKYSPVEFLQGARYYQGTRSPNAAEREFKGFSDAWLHHKGRNKHHFEYWIDVPGKDGALMSPSPMPTRYIVEMLCDRIAACKIYQGDAYTTQSPLEYFLLRETSGAMHPDTAAFLVVLLSMLAEKGEEETLRFVREQVVAKRFAVGEYGRF